MSDTIITYIEKELLNGQPGSGPGPQEDLLGSGLIDSIGIMRLIAFIERQYDLKVPYEDMTIENFMTVEAIVQYLEKRTQ